MLQRETQNINRKKKPKILNIKIGICNFFQTSIVNVCFVSSIVSDINTKFTETNIFGIFRLVGREKGKEKEKKKRCERGKRENEERKLRKIKKEKIYKIEGNTLHTVKLEMKYTREK